MTDLPPARGASEALDAIEQGLFPAQAADPFPTATEILDGVMAILATAPGVTIRPYDYSRPIVVRRHAVELGERLEAQRARSTELLTTVLARSVMKQTDPKIQGPGILDQWPDQEVIIWRPADEQIGDVGSIPYSHDGLCMRGVEAGVYYVHYHLWLAAGPA